MRLDSFGVIGGQGCQIEPNFPPNLATLAAVGCQIGREICPNLATLLVVERGDCRRLFGTF